jgi:D-glycero-alpha-D-manno-heptose-7-phosphate kinase
VEKSKITTIKKNKNMYKELFYICAEASEKIYTAKNLPTFLSKYVNESWEIKKKLAKKVSNPDIDNLRIFGMKNGAIAGKIVGSGSGGFMLFICKDHKDKQKLKKKINKNVCMDVKFDYLGSQIINK